MNYLTVLVFRSVPFGSFPFCSFFLFLAAAALSTTLFGCGPNFIKFFFNSFGSSRVLSWLQLRRTRWKTLRLSFLFSSRAISFCYFGTLFFLPGISTGIDRVVRDVFFSLSLSLSFLFASQ